MKVYNRKYHKNVERVIHFGVGEGTYTACGQVLFSRFILVSVFSNTDPSLITSDITKVTCKRCLKTRESRFRKLLAINQSCPGIFDHPFLCGEQWLLDHALNVSQSVIDSQTLQIGTLNLRFNMKSADRKAILKDKVKKESQ